MSAQGRSYPLRNLDVLYIGRGIPDISFESQTTENPAIFYLLSYPAHRNHPVTLVTKEEAKPTPLGSQETCNQRIVNRYIHLEGARSCQLVMGVTTLTSGSAWNTMPRTPTCGARRFICTSTLRPMRASFT
jgi:4-deoxy-L-threo-5-hexosulose-uronate ketol-isomerase